MKDGEGRERCIMTENNTTSVQEQYLNAVATLNSTAYEVYYLADFFLLHSAQAKDLLTLWYDTFRLDKSLRSPLLYTANEILLKAGDIGDSKPAWGYIEGFGSLLEELAHFLGRDRDYPALVSYLKVLLIWEKLPCRAFTKDYIRMVVLLTEVYSRQGYLSEQLHVSMGYRKIEEYEVTRKLKQVSDLQEEFAARKALCDEKQGEKEMAWLFPTSQTRGLQLLESISSSLMLLTRILETEYLQWKATN